MKLYTTADAEFALYGRKLDIDCSELLEAAKGIELPKEGSLYHAEEEAFAKTEIANYFRETVFGELPIEMGYCFGHSNRLNALEWHKNSEINIAVTDMVLLLGKQEQMTPYGHFDSGDCKAFLIKQGECIEVYATTLHFCPCEVSEAGFGCVVVLPKDTNLPLDKEPSSDPLLFRKNKWIIAHVDNAPLIARGVVGNLTGVNYTVSYENGKVEVR